MHCSVVAIVDIVTFATLKQWNNLHVTHLNAGTALPTVHPYKTVSLQRENCGGNSEERFA